MSLKLLLTVIVITAAAGVQAQVPAIPAQVNVQAKMLESSDPLLAQNKKLVYDLWRTTISAGHVELAPNYIGADFVDHNPNMPPGLQGYMQVLAKALKPISIPSTIKGLIGVVAEGDLVMLAFENDWSAAAKGSPLHDEPNSFEMFRVKEGKVIEHWDSMPRHPKSAEGSAPGVPAGNQ